DAAEQCARHRGHRRERKRNRGDLRAVEGKRHIAAARAGADDDVPVVHVVGLGCRCRVERDPQKGIDRHCNCSCQPTPPDHSTKRTSTARSPPVFTVAVALSKMSKKPPGSAVNWVAPRFTSTCQSGMFWWSVVKVLAKVWSWFFCAETTATAEPNSLLSLGPVICTMPPASAGWVPSVALSENAMSMSTAEAVASAAFVKRTCLILALVGNRQSR